MSESNEINLVKVGERLGVTVYNGSIRAEILLDHCGYPTYDPKLKGIIDGYQREQKEANVQSVAERTRKNINDWDAFIDNINGNVRDPNVENLMVKPLNPKKTDRGDFYVFSYAPESLKHPEIWTVDGQTRVKGLARARANAIADKNFKEVARINEEHIGITLTFTSDVYKECFQFYLMNHYSTNIPPEGALRMMYDGFKAGKVDFDNEITSGRGRTNFADIQAMEVTERLSIHSAVWKDAISDFNEDNKANKISIKAVTNILKPLAERIEVYKNAKGLNKTTETLTFEIFDAFWQGLDLWHPPMFDIQTKHQFGIMKSSQAEVLTRVLIAIFDEHESWSILGSPIGDLTKPKTYEKLIKPAYSNQNLYDVNGAGTTVYGPDCWRVGKAGSMGKYTNSAAKRDMRDKLFSNIKAELKKTNPKII